MPDRMTSLSQPFQGGVGPIVYHGTPLTPRAAFSAIMPGRSSCVSYFRPDNLEAVLAECPQVMFRQRRILILDAGASSGRGPDGCAEGRLVGLLRLAGPDGVSSGQVGNHPRHSGRPVPAQRRASERLAFRGSGGAGLAYGRPAGSAGTSLRTILPRLPRMDRRPEEGAGGLRGLFPAHGRGGRPDGQFLAPAAYAPRNTGCSPISLRQRGQHVSGAERTPL